MVIGFNCKLDSGIGGLTEG